MNTITKPKEREIIEDFAKEIQQRKTQASPPKTSVIDFRDELIKGVERPVESVPLNLLRYRKNNGRISSDIFDYEKNHGILDEKSKETQKIVSEFLENRNKDKTEELKNSIMLKGQQEPAIITCDGFLINGNRRRLVIEMLSNLKKGDPRFERMKVVILPGKSDEGGPPTLKEIEQIENRYQLQSMGKAEYYGFDRALSIRRKIGIGMSLEEQLKDDPSFAHLPLTKFKKEMKKFEEEYLEPLACIDRYLDYLNRPGLYSTVALGLGDTEGRWQAFIDYSKSVYKKLNNDKERMKIGIDENEVGKIENIAFKIIRKRELTNLPKPHEIMRRLPQMLANKEAKKELLKLTKIDLTLPKKESVDKNGKEHTEREKDKVWGELHKRDIIWRIKKAIDHQEGIKESEEPLDLLDIALKKLNHANMRTNKVHCEDFSKRIFCFKHKGMCFKRGEADLRYGINSCFKRNGVDVG